jgi:Zn-dependent protease with chaperone function
LIPASTTTAQVIAKARLFGAGSKATGEPAELRVVGEQIVVRSASAEHRAPIAALRVRRIGVDESGLEFGWDSIDGTRAVQVQDADSLRVLSAQPLLAAAPQLLAVQMRQRRKSVARLFGWTAIGVFVLLPILLLLVFFWQADRIATAAASRISIAQEVALGEQAFASMRSTLTLQESGPEPAAVRQLGERLSRGSAYTYRLHVATTEVINAFALPGGIIVVNSGLIEATRRPEELAGVLAHEIQHVEQRHSLQAIVKELGVRGLWLLVTGDAGSTLISSAALQLSSLKFSRDAEAQADAAGYDAMVASGIDPRGMIDFFAMMSQQNQAAPPPFLSTHPGSAQREAALEAKQAALRGRRFEPLQLGSWPP